MGRRRRMRKRHKRNVMDRAIVKKLNTSPEMISLVQILHRSSPDFQKSKFCHPALFSESALPTTTRSYRGICACIKKKKKIAIGTTLLHLPEKLLIKPQDISISDELTFSETDLHDRFALFLALESEKLESSILAYLGTLPKNFAELPVYLTDDKLNFLPRIYQELIRKQRQTALAAFAVFQQHFPELKFEKFMYCWLAVNTRSVYYEPYKGKREMALAPYIDLFNHSQINPNAEARFDEGNRAYIIESTRNIQSNEEIFISYGNHPNFKLWIEYGFVPLEDNPHTYIPISDSLELGIFASKQFWFHEVIKDDRKRKIVHKYNLLKELSFMDEELSPNLSLLIQLYLWNPDMKNFDFFVDHQNPEFVKIAQLVVDAEIRTYETCLTELVNLDLPNPAPALQISTLFILDSIKFLKSLKDQL